MCAAVLCDLEKERINLMGIILNVHICLHVDTYPCKFIRVHKRVSASISPCGRRSAKE